MEGQKNEEKPLSDADPKVSKEISVPQDSVPHQTDQSLPPTPVPQRLAADPSALIFESSGSGVTMPPNPVPQQTHAQRHVLPTHPTSSIARAQRLRKMAALYDRLADLMREEAREYLPAEERAFVDEVERQAL